MDFKGHWKAGILAVALVLMVIAFQSPLVSTQDPGEAPASVGDDPVMGQEDAPVTLVKFTDFGCPFCKRWHENTLPQIESNYVESGDVKIVYKDAPIPQLHPGAGEAHAAANCVYDNEGAEAYFEFTDVLYSNQNQFAGSTGNQDTLISLASDAGYDIESCLNNNDYRDEIDEDKQEAQAAGLQGTPQFVVKASDSDTGTPVQGAQPFSAFDQAIENQLSTSDSENSDEEEKEDNESNNDNEENESNNSSDQNSEENSCNGCMYEGNCLPIGHRLEDNEESKYCTASGDLEIQKDLNNSCQNNYECETNTCSSGQCISIKEEIEQNRGILKSISDFFEKLFG